MKHLKPLKAGYYIVRWKDVPVCEIAEYSPEIDCFLLCGDPMPRDTDQVLDIIARVDVGRFKIAPNNLLWLSLVCLVLSVILTILHTPCDQ